LTLNGVLEREKQLYIVVLKIENILFTHFEWFEIQLEVP
jgi:hypothetical protein